MSEFCDSDEMKHHMREARDCDRGQFKNGVSLTEKWQKFFNFLRVVAHLGILCFKHLIANIVAT